MKSVVLLLAVLLAACQRGAASPRTAARHSELRTIDNVDTRPAISDVPPVLPDEAAAPKPRDPVAAQNQVPLTEADEQLRARLPFAPAIAMDPVDGSKISIRTTTPTVEVKGKIYYFSSEENKRTFMANPDQYTKGLFSHL